jgi:WD40 repeat protein
MQYDKDKIVSAGAAGDRKIFVWDRRTNQIMRRFKGHMGGIYCLYYAKEMLWAGSTEEIRIWNLNTGDCLFCNTDEHPSFVMGIQGDRWKMVSGGYGSYTEGDGDICAKIWDMQSRKVVKSLRGHTKAIRCLQYDHHILVTGAMDGLLLVYNLEEQASSPLASSVDTPGPSKE